MLYTIHISNLVMITFNMNEWPSLLYMAFPSLFCSFSLLLFLPATPLIFISDDLSFFQTDSPVLLPNEDIFSETSGHATEIPRKDCSQLPCSMLQRCSTMRDSPTYLLIEKGPDPEHTQKFVTLLTTA